MLEEKNSFTLTEVILTLIIIGILAAVVLPRFGIGLVSTSKLRSTVSQIASDIRYTRQLAITNSAHYLINFNLTLKEYNIYQDSISPANQIGETKKISSEISLSGTNQFDFYAIGNVIFAGSGLSLSLNTSQYTITAEPPTGAVIIEKIS